jgi:hypothetical protein
MEKVDVLEGRSNTDDSICLLAEDLFNNFDNILDWKYSREWRDDRNGNKKLYN